MFLTIARFKNTTSIHITKGILSSNEVFMYINFNISKYKSTIKLKYFLRNIYNKY